MRIKSLNRRVPLTGKSDSELFAPELDYYREHNRYPITLFGVPITNIYKNINLQILVTKACNAKCGFCIENDGPAGKQSDPAPMLRNMATVLAVYADAGILPNVSITGGEPTLFQGSLLRILELTAHLKRVNVNTNGTDMRFRSQYPKVLINLSRHHFDEDANAEVFRRRIPLPPLDAQTFMQCVMMRGAIETIDDLRNYISHFAALGAGGFSFRGLTRLDGMKGYVSEMEFCQHAEIPFLRLLDQVASSEDFEFVQQKIGDHYLYEIYRFCGRPVRFTYSNFDFLRAVESKERAAGERFARATIISHDGSVYSGWAFDINRIIEGGSCG